MFGQEIFPDHQRPNQSAIKDWTFMILEGFKLLEAFRRGMEEVLDFKMKIGV